MTGISICLAIVAVLALMASADTLRAPPRPPKLARGKRCGLMARDIVRVGFQDPQIAIPSPPIGATAVLR